MERRHDALRETAGLNAEVWDALVILAAGSLDPEAIGRGHEAVLGLVKEMDEERRRRLLRLGFEEARAAALSSLHTRKLHVRVLCGACSAAALALPRSSSPAV